MNEDLRQAIPFEEFDYQALMGALADYARPRDKVTDLLAKGIIVRVKKGLYIFGEKWRRKPFSREILANLLYGPSCVSLDYALHYHGLIPERVEAVTSVTTKRGARFNTPRRALPLQQCPGGRLLRRPRPGRVGGRQGFSDRCSGEGTGGQVAAGTRPGAEEPEGVYGVHGGGPADRGGGPVRTGHWAAR